MVTTGVCRVLYWLLLSLQLSANVESKIKHPHCGQVLTLWCCWRRVPLVFVDVNKVPGSVVYSNGIRKMPTIAVRLPTLYKQDLCRHCLCAGCFERVQGSHQALGDVCRCTAAAKRWQSTLQPRAA